MYKIEQAKTFEGENSAKDANKCVQEVLQVCSRGFNSVFQKVVTDSSTPNDPNGFGCVYVYDNQDGEFPIKISVLRKDNVRRVLLSIESARVANERLDRKNASYVAENTNETKVVELHKSPVSFLPMRGHPRKVSLLMALVELSGVDVTNRIPDKVVRYQFEKSVGPFTSVVVKMDNVAKPLFAGLEPFKGGGMATQVVSCVTRREPTFETAVRRVRDVKTALARESRIYNFVDRTEEGSCYDVRTASPTLGGWMVFISVRRVATDDYEYKMLLERNLRTDSQTRDISVEVEL